MFFKNNFHNKAKKVCIKTRSPSALLPYITVKWPIGGFHFTSSPLCWWTVNKRSLISSLCLSTSICSFHHCYLCLPRLHENHLLHEIGGDNKHQNRLNVPIVYLPSLNLPKIPMHSRSALSFLAKVSTTWIVCVDERGSTRQRQQQLDSTVFLKVRSKHWPGCYCSAMNWLESPFYPFKICWIVDFSFQTILKYTFSAPFWIRRLGYLVKRRGCLVCACAKTVFCNQRKWRKPKEWM